MSVFESSNNSENTMYLIVCDNNPYGVLYDLDDLSSHIDDAKQYIMRREFSLSYNYHWIHMNEKKDDCILKLVLVSNDKNNIGVSYDRLEHTIEVYQTKFLKKELEVVQE